MTEALENAPCSLCDGTGRRRAVIRTDADGFEHVGMVPCGCRPPATAPRHDYCGTHHDPDAECPPPPWRAPVTAPTSGRAPLISASWTVSEWKVYANQLDQFMTRTGRRDQVTLDCLSMARSAVRRLENPCLLRRGPRW